jgi:hypothetical protein
MDRLNGIERLPGADQVKVYSDLAAHYRAMAAISYTDSVSLMFSEMSAEMYERADAVLVFAPLTTEVEQC